ncbi:DUF551 domain-containing protein [Enterobacter cloacae]|uniref:DUF551 domain-containing protein n=1 Tax=Enterobacter cloacae TaxID=550 RepID=UPI00210BA849|nr:DUF551 domain-containing protein [Enterobacter cloacae]MCQ4408523.1 DUF551 domain-containing protein [Enterobacter cloacae]
MSTFTKEQLIARINQVTAINKYRISRDPDADGLAMDNELFAIALASLEAEAVGEVVLGEYDDCGCHPDARVECIAADGQADWENFKDGTRLYAAPPSMVVIDERAAFNAWNNDENLPIAGVGAKNAAWLAWQARAKLAAPPAPVSVPAAMEMDDDFDSAFEHGKAVGWNAYRAAMLQSFGNSEQLNSPVIQDAWVACSERMPIENDIVLVVDDGYFVCEAQYREGDFFSAARGKGEFFETTCRDVELWMPLPAATQQEVK